MKSLKAKHAYETRWMYHTEKHVLKNPYACKERSMDDIRIFAKMVWDQEMPKNTRKKIPTIKAGKGMFYLGKYCSYCDESNIVLIRSHRNYGILLHELTHAMGENFHGRSFVARYFPLLWTYANYDRNFLTIIASERGYNLEQL